MSELVLSVTIETIPNAVIIPIDDINALQVREEGVFLDGELYLWEDITKVVITKVAS